MSRRFHSLAAAVAIALTSAGCMNGVIGPATSSSIAVDEVVAKALDVAAQIGGDEGFGGSLMDGYLSHMPSQMGFRSAADLAPEGANMTVALHNESDVDGTFHLSYFVRHVGLGEQTMDVDVEAGETVAVEILCAEIVGVGPLNEPGEAGCHLDDGQIVSNIMAAPGFLGEDFTCQDTFECWLVQDVDDLDGDGDTEELIILSEAMDLHMTDGGPTGHHHDETDIGHGHMHP